MRETVFRSLRHAWDHRGFVHMLDPVELFPEVPNLYEFPSIHADMVFDERRVRAYRRAIDAAVADGDVVVDIGAGTGLLSFLCLQAGARRVHAIERSPVIRWAQLLAEKNGFADRMVFHHADAREIDLGVKVDVIVSELIGHLAFEEGMAETIVDVKDRFLKPGGTLIPAKVSLHAALVCEASIYPDYVDCWGTIWGIDFSVLREQASRTAYVTDITERDLLSKSQEVLAWDFSQTPGAIERTLGYTTLRKGTVNGIALWFDAQLGPTIRLSSGPWTKTHWRQCFIPFREPIPVSAGDDLQIAFEMRFRSRSRDPFVLNAFAV